jgi:hypothetical protein
VEGKRDYYCLKTGVIGEGDLIWEEYINSSRIYGQTDSDAWKGLSP